MNRIFVVMSALVLLAGSVLAKITLPATEVFKLDNGMTVNVIQRHQLPLFSVQLTFRAGSIHDPVGKEGLASLTSDMFLRGTTARTAKQIADDVAFGGGTLSNACSYVSAGFNGEFLTTQGEKAVEILADLVRNSTFAAEEFDKTRTLALGGLQNRRENPSNVANEAMWEEILGESRYAHYFGGTSPGMEGLTREDIATFARNHYTPDNCILVVCGDITPESVHQWVTKHFGSWKGTAELNQVEAAFPAVSDPRVVLYDKADASQTQIRIGANGIPLNHPDYPALEVARTIYGGTFASRLMDEIRVNRGLTYGVAYRSSHFKPGGVVFVTTFTKNATVGEVIDIILAEALKMQNEPVSDSELADGVAYRCGTYPLDFETNDDLAGVFANLWLNDLDRSYYEDYQEKIKAVTPAQVADAAKMYFPKDRYCLVIVGKADEVKAQVERYGPVSVKSF